MKVVGMAFLTVPEKRSVEHAIYVVINFMLFFSKLIYLYDFDQGKEEWKTKLFLSNYSLVCQSFNVIIQQVLLMYEYIVTTKYMYMV